MSIARSNVSSESLSNLSFILESLTPTTTLSRIRQFFAELGELSYNCVILFCCFRRDGWLITSYVNVRNTSCASAPATVNKMATFFLSSDPSSPTAAKYHRKRSRNLSLQEPFPPQFMWWLQFVHLFGSFILNANSWYHGVEVSRAKTRLGGSSGQEVHILHVNI